ncbi:PhzF family phenazine biosynthesis protein [Alicyclobacillus fastidiosus]|uniref:PhzF family phenazine biosynthesis isomerase n=1 Tax=Alicyclobacillus fastidiosus TaxID=392011 RepID=A0ABV5ALK7_9BACL|nr:PhzF family phenazine biosynthesis isomerase [Alicyclobacillus fastidiosus]WEH10224.1 PhzF family phenazine biosynthesis isomerase [Alicyclobacillus fastidiosus]
MATSIEVSQVDAFTTTPFHGNPAGVVLNAQGIEPRVRQQIARELNCSETVFIEQHAMGRFAFRYYTPATEVDLCGHATVAALHTLHEAHDLSGDILVDTNVGVLPMRIEQDGTVWMRQADPQFRELEGEVRRAVVSALRVEEADIHPSLPFQLAFTGLWDILVPLKKLDALHQLEPQFDVLAAICRELGAASVHVYTMETVEAGSTVHTRDFSPAVGVNEDPHTGTANGALGASLVHAGVIEPKRHVFEQGWSIGRPGHILVDVTQDMAVSVGGKAVTAFCAQLRTS